MRNPYRTAVSGRRPVLIQVLPFVAQNDCKEPRCHYVVSTGAVGSLSSRGSAVAKARKQRGFTIAEAGASMALLLPLVIMLVFVVLEASYAYLIKTSMSQAAREAARDLAIAYGQNPAIASDRSLQDSLVFNNIRIPKMVASSQQFEDPVFDTAGNPPTVSVRVRYMGGQFGLPQFPNPDPLNLGSGLVIDGTNTYRLE